MALAFLRRSKIRRPGTLAKSELCAADEDFEVLTPEVGPIWHHHAVLFFSHGERWRWLDQFPKPSLFPHQSPAKFQLDTLFQLAFAGQTQWQEEETGLFFYSGEVGRGLSRGEILFDKVRNQPASPPLKFSHVQRVQGSMSERAYMHVSLLSVDNVESPISVIGA